MTYLYALLAAVGASVAWPIVRGRVLWFLRSEAECWRTACHEAGHAYVAWHSPFVTKIPIVTVMPPNRKVNGYVIHLHLKETETAIEGKAEMGRISLAGMAAVESLLGEKPDMTQGSDDLLRAYARALSLTNDLSFQENCRAVISIAKLLHAGRVDIMTAIVGHQMYAIATLWYIQVLAMVSAPEARDRIGGLARELMKRRTLRHDDVGKILGPRPPIVETKPAP